jgi:hypothetical protein
MSNDNYNKGFGGQFGDRTDFDYRRGEQDRARLMEGRQAATGASNSGSLSPGPAVGGAGGGPAVMLLVLLPLLFAIAASVLSIGVILALMMVVLLNILPGHAPVSFGGAMRLGVMGGIGCVIGMVLSGAALMLLAQGDGHSQMWLTVPILLEIASLSGAGSLVMEFFTQGFEGQQIPLELPGLLIAKALMWGPAVFMFARTYARNATFKPIPRRLMFPFGAALGALAFTAAFPIATWIANMLMLHFAPFTERLGTSSPPQWEIAIIPGAAALAVFFAGGLIAGPVYALASQLYRKPLGSPGYFAAAFRWAFAYVLAGILVLFVMAFWPAGDPLVMWSFDAALPDGVTFAAASGLDPALRPAGFLDTVPGYMLASLPAILMLAWMLHSSGRFRKNQRHDVLIALFMAIWPMLVIVPAAAFVGVSQLFTMFGAPAP